VNDLTPTCLCDPCVGQNCIQRDVSITYTMVVNKTHLIQTCTTVSVAVLSMTVQLLLAARARRCIGVTISSRFSREPVCSLLNVPVSRWTVSRRFFGTSWFRARLGLDRISSIGVARGVLGARAPPGRRKIELNLQEKVVSARLQTEGAGRARVQYLRKLGRSVSF